MNVVFVVHRNLHRAESDISKETVDRWLAWLDWQCMLVHLNVTPAASPRSSELVLTTTSQAGKWAGTYQSFDDLNNEATVSTPTEATTVKWMPATFDLEEDGQFRLTTLSTPTHTVIESLSVRFLPLLVRMVFSWGCCYLKPSALIHQPAAALFVYVLGRCPCRPAALVSWAVMADQANGPEFGRKQIDNY